MLMPYNYRKIYKAAMDDRCLICNQILNYGKACLYSYPGRQNGYYIGRVSIANQNSSISERRGPNTFFLKICKKCSLFYVSDQELNYLSYMGYSRYSQVIKPVEIPVNVSIEYDPWVERVRERYEKNRALSFLLTDEDVTDEYYFPDYCSIFLGREEDDFCDHRDGNPHKTINTRYLFPTKKQGEYIEKDVFICRDCCRVFCDQDTYMSLKDELPNKYLFHDTISGYYSFLRHFDKFGVYFSSYKIGGKPYKEETQEKLKALLNEKKKIAIGEQINIIDDDVHICGDTLLGFDPIKAEVLDNSNLRKCISAGYCCKCQRFFVSMASYQKDCRFLNKYKFKKWVPESTVVEESDIENWDRKETDNDDTGVFYTRTNTFFCQTRGHHIREIEAVINVLGMDGEIMKYHIPAIECSNCSKKYILETDYQALKKRGIIICRIVEMSFWETQEIVDGMNLQPEALLHILGYNVNATVGYTNGERQSILDVILSEGLMKKHEILNHLDYLINTRCNNPSMREAVGKWETDRRYVANWKGRNSTSETVEVIYHRQYHT